ncbi:MAG: hypothetical protein SGI92_31880 [Bryobacteraceae bacterium]|nr:hypothetical protein [Bryobacteraceae bacterium]
MARVQISRRVLPLLLLLAVTLLAAGPGFRSQRLLDAHYAKHGHEFGNITKQQYLALAQSLRDTAASATVLEAKRPGDGVVTKFDRKKGYFGAYERDRTIRTFFIPAAGESYFKRQAKR